LETEHLSLEELAERAGVSARTIRFYQAEKLLPKPERDPRDGRVAAYTPRHVELLELIGTLRDRGLRLPAIRNLLSEGDPQTNVADWLGLDAAVRGAWTQDEPRLLSRTELAELLKDAPTGLASQLEEARLIRREGSSWVMASPAQVELVMRIAAGGVPVERILEAGAILHASLSRAARELIELFVEFWNDGQAREESIPAQVEALRPFAGDAARVIFAQQLEMAVERLMANPKRLKKR
jgi:DNA-binding transcriptional MerR regulator